MNVREPATLDYAPLRTRPPMSWARVFGAALQCFCWPLGFACLLGAMHALRLTWHLRAFGRQPLGLAFLVASVLVVPIVAWRRFRSWRVVSILVLCGAVSGAPLKRHDEICQVSLTCAGILAAGMMLLSRRHRSDPAC